MFNTTSWEGKWIGHYNYYENYFVFSKIKRKRHTFNNTHGITGNKMLPDSLRPVEQPFGLACFNNNQYKLSDRQATFAKEKGVG